MSVLRVLLCGLLNEHIWFFIFCVAYFWAAAAAAACAVVEPGLDVVFFSFQLVFLFLLLFVIAAAAGFCLVLCKGT